MADLHNCHCCIHQFTAQQTLSEMDFERGIWSAAMNGDMDRVSVLVNKGHAVNATDSSGYTALHYACRYGFTNVARFLLDKGACPNAQTRSGRVTPLHRAAYCGYVDVVRLLLDRGADPSLRDEDGRNAIHKAAEKPKTELLALLVQTAASSINVKDARHKLPLDYLPSSAGPDILQLLKPNEI